MWDEMLRQDIVTAVPLASASIITGAVKEAQGSGARLPSPTVEVSESAADDMRIVDTIIRNFERQVSVLPVGWDLTLHIGESSSPMKKTYADHAVFQRARAMARSYRRRKRMAEVSQHAALLTATDDSLFRPQTSQWWLRDRSCTKMVHSDLLYTLNPYAITLGSGPTAERSCAG